MLSIESLIKVSDNSGAKNAKCIKVFGSGLKRYAYVGSLILVTVKKRINQKKIKKKTIYYGIIIVTKYLTQRKDGINIRFNENRILLFSKTYKFLGTRIYGPIMKELKFQIFNNKKEKQKYMKIISYCKALI